MKKVSLSIYLLSLLCVIVSCSKASYTEATPLIKKFALKGNLAEKVIEVSNKKRFRIYYPENATSKLAIVVWGNGSSAGPDKYDKIMRHLSQWGFLVIDTYSENTGTGKEISEAVDYVLDAQFNADNVLYNKLDIDNIAVVGHSQGATGVINCHTNFSVGKKIKTIVSVALPTLKLTDDEHKYDVSKIKGTFLVLGGKRDRIISPIKSNREAIEKTQNIPALALLLKGVAHNEIQNDGGNYRGILTAWLNYQLKNDDEAELVFKGNQAEIYNTEVIDEIFKKNF